MMMSKDEMLSLAAYTLTSKYRFNVLIVLNERGVLTPKYIALHCGILQNHISNTLRELKEHGLVECINPKARKGRLYRLTSLGVEVYLIALELDKMGDEVV